MNGIAIGLGLALGTPAAALRAQTTWYVDASYGGPGSGTMGDPFSSIQYAIDQPRTLDGDALLILPGCYLETVDLRGKTLTLEGSAGADHTAVDGGGLQTVFRILAGEAPEFRGLTIKNGGGTELAGVMRGGGVLCLGSSATFRDCKFVDNDLPHSFPTPRGGGIYADGSHLVLEDCELSGHENGEAIYATGSTVELAGSSIHHNTNFGGGVEPLQASGITLVVCESTLIGCDVSSNGNRVLGVPDQGGGIVARGGTLRLEDSLVADNSGEFRGGGIALFGCEVTIEGCAISRNESFDGYFGGGLYAAASPASSGTISNTAFCENGAGDGGGAFLGAGDFTFTRCTFAANHVSSLYSEQGSGGGLYVLDGASVSVVRSLFHGNTALGQVLFGEGGRGGGVYGRANLDRCTLVENTAAHGFARLAEGGGAFAASLASSIVWDNVPESLGGRSTVTYSDVEGGWPGLGNFDLDPRFRDAASRDHRLHRNSPCIDAGDPAGPPDADGSRPDVGAFPFLRRERGARAVITLRSR